MSYEAQAVVISGYSVPRDIWHEAFEYCDQHWKTDPSIPVDWEDYFIDMNPMTGNGETFFGEIIYRVDEYAPCKEFDTILATASTIMRVQNAFDSIFTNFYMIKGYPLPKYNKYLGVRII